MLFTIEVIFIYMENISEELHCIYCRKQTQPARGCWPLVLLQSFALIIRCPYTPLKQHANGSGALARRTAEFSCAGNTCRILGTPGGLHPWTVSESGCFGSRCLTPGTAKRIQLRTSPALLCWNQGGSWQGFSWKEGSAEVLQLVQQYCSRRGLKSFFKNRIQY